MLDLEWSGSATEGSAEVVGDVAGDVVGDVVGDVMTDAVVRAEREDRMWGAVSARVGCVTAPDPSEGG
ncbi:MAG: hypothetical protein ACOYMM_13335 [Phycisphaerales bacterium]